VVDDDSEIVETYAAWLSREYDVKTATGGEKALETIDSDVGVVLLDRRMPEMPGSEALERLEKEGYDASVAMVTAVEPDFDIVSMGFDDYLVKPVAREELFETVERLFERDKYDEAIAEHYSLLSKKALLEERKSKKELDESDEYSELLERIDEVGDRIEEISEGMSSDDFEAVMRGLQDRA